MEESQWQITVTNNHSTQLVSQLGQWAIIGILGLDDAGLTSLRDKIGGLVFDTLKEDNIPKILSPTQQLAVSLIKSRVRP
jgi:hypothetical protein